MNHQLFELDMTLIPCLLKGSYTAGKLAKFKVSWFASWLFLSPLGALDCTVIPSGEEHYN